MTPHQVRIVQVFRVEREIIVAVDAPDIQTTIDIQEEREVSGFDDPGWRSSWTLENEEISQVAVG